MHLTTPVIPSIPHFRLLPETPVLLLGSCFSDEMAVRMQQSGLPVAANPFGTLYNPASIATLLSRALDDVPISEEQMVFHDGLWHSWLHHTSFSSPDRDTCLSLCNEAIHRTFDLIHGAQPPVLILTFGTAYVFSLTTESPQTLALPGTPSIVANCHKLPASYFTRRCLSVAEICKIWQPLLMRLMEKGIRIIFTVSPIRHLADGAHDNQLSKSTLMLAIDQLIGMEPERFCYFPSYEILMDELRDYRFYDRDLCHPSDLAVDILWERFSQTFFTPAHQQQLILNRKHYRQTLHRPISSQPQHPLST